MRNLLFSRQEQECGFLARRESHGCQRLEMTGIRLTADDSEPRTENYYASAPLACSTSVLNAAASRTARSARILRSSSTPAFFNPWMNWL